MWSEFSIFSQFLEHHLQLEKQGMRWHGQCRGRRLNNAKMFFSHDLRCTTKYMASCLWSHESQFQERLMTSSSGVHMIAFGFTDKFLLLYSPVLEPDGDLALWEVGAGRDAPSLVFGDELAGRILFLQLLQLDLCVRDTFLTPTSVTAYLRLQWHNICRDNKCRQILDYMRKTAALFT